MTTVMDSLTSANIRDPAADAYGRRSGSGRCVTPPRFYGAGLEAPELLPHALRIGGERALGGVEFVAPPARLRRVPPPLSRRQVPVNPDSERLHPPPPCLSVRC